MHLITIVTDGSMATANIGYGLTLLLVSWAASEMVESKEGKHLQAMPNSDLLPRVLALRTETPILANILFQLLPISPVSKGKNSQYRNRPSETNNEIIAEL